MRFSVRHTTSYHYSAPIRLGPHQLRLMPRAECTFLLEVTPPPVSRREGRDSWGNRVIELEFAGDTQVFSIETQFSLDTTVPHSLPSGLPPLPWPAEIIDPALTPFLMAEDPGPEVRRFAEGLAQGTGSAIAFLVALNETLYTRTDRHIRMEGNARSAAETLATGRGACRDLTELFIAAARCQGIPARFVSGYQAHSESPDGRRHLHAWPEVHIPGYGWRGFDPTHGRPVTDGHVALAVAPSQAGTMPIEGSFWGGAVSSTLDYDISIRAAE